MRILVAGQTGAGKSSLVNALANAVEAAVDVVPATASFTAYRLTHEGLPAALLIDSPGLTGDARSIDAPDRGRRQLRHGAVGRAPRRAPRATIDAAALDAIRAHFAAEPNRRRPPMLLVLTHIDALRPFNEWQPPYDLTSATSRQGAVDPRAPWRPRARSSGFAADEIVPVRVDIAVAPYNIDALWAKIIELMPEAQRARLLRTLGDIKSASAWGAIWSQAVNAGRVIKGTFLTRSTTP